MVLPIWEYYLTSLFYVGMGWTKTFSNNKDFHIILCVCVCVVKCLPYNLRIPDIHSSVFTVLRYHCFSHWLNRFHEGSRLLHFGFIIFFSLVRFCPLPALLSSSLFCLSDCFCAVHVTNGQTSIQFACSTHNEECHSTLFIFYIFCCLSVCLCFVLFFLPETVSGILAGE